MPKNVVDKSNKNKQPAKNNASKGVDKEPEKSEGEKRRQRRKRKASESDSDEEVVVS